MARSSACGMQDDALGAKTRVLARVARVQSADDACSRRARGLSRGLSLPLSIASVLGLQPLQRARDRMQPLRQEPGGDRRLCELIVNYGRLARVVVCLDTVVCDTVAHFPPIVRIVHGEYKVVLGIYYAKLTLDKTCMLTSSRSCWVRAKLCVCKQRTKTSLQTVHYLSL